MLSNTVSLDFSVPSEVICAVNVCHGDICVVIYYDIEIRAGGWGSFVSENFARFLPPDPRS